MSLKQQTFIAYSFGGWQVQNEGASRSGANEGFIPGLQMAVFSLYPHMAEGREKKQALSRLISVLIPFMRLHCHNLI